MSMYIFLIVVNTSVEIKVLIEMLTTKLILAEWWSSKFSRVQGHVQRGTVICRAMT